MADDLTNGAADLPDAGADLPAGDAGGDEGYADDLAAELEASRDEPAEAGGDEPGYSADIRQAIEESGNALVEAETARTWETELDTMYRQALELHGLTPEQAQQQGITVQDATRRLYRAEQILKSDPAQGMAWLAQSYAASLDPTQRAAVAGQVLRALGFENPGGIAEQERQELQQWRAYRQQAQQHQAQQAQEYRAAEAKAEQTIAQFAQGKADFTALRPTMAALMQAGAANDLASAYALARRVQGGATPGQSAEAQRQAVLRAKAARTPKTASVPVPADDDGDSELPQKELLAKMMRERAGNGAARRA